MRGRTPERELANLQEWRGIKPRDLTLKDVMGAAAKGLKKQARSLGGLGAAWQELAPPDVVDRTSLVGLSRGVLTVRCEDASARFELDRWLRCGGETQLVKRSPAGLTRVRLVVGGERSR